ncbi:MAG: CheR family methyltransferase [Candidatus Ozemobacteraceae bacterium]
MAFTFFFRDLHTLEHLVNALVPTVAGRSVIRIWDAGCAMGPEVYTLAMLLAEKMGYFSFKNLRIEASDLDEQDQFGPIVCSGAYPDAELQRIPPDFFSKYFVSCDDRPGFSRLIDHVRTRVFFRKHNLLSLEPIGDSFSMILCKNVLLHFTPAERIEVIQVFHKSLAPQGFFAMEQTQPLPDELAGYFRRVVPDAQLYQKIELP